METMQFEADFNAGLIIAEDVMAVFQYDADRELGEDGRWFIGITSVELVEVFTDGGTIDRYTALTVFGEKSVKQAEEYAQTHIEGRFEMGEAA